MPNITLQEMPIGSQFTSAIGNNEPEDKNDFRVRIALDSNGTGLTMSGITVSADSSIVSLTGSHSAWEVIIRPPTTADVVTLTIAEDAFSEGNSETSKDIRVSTFFPDTDAETPTQLFTHGITTARGITTSPSRIIILASANNTVSKFTFAGSLVSAETATLPIGTLSGSHRHLDFFNGDLIVSNNLSGDVNRYYQDSATSYALADDYTLNVNNSIFHTRYGVTNVGVGAIVGIDGNGNSSGASGASPWGRSGTTANQPPFAASHQDDRIYGLTTRGGEGLWSLTQITEDDGLEHIGTLNIERDDDDGDIAINQDTLYLLRDDTVYTVDIKKYRPMARNTKTTIYPVFATNGDTIPLKQYCPDADTLIFGLGFDKPDWLTINVSGELEIASDAASETTPVLVRLTGINYIDSADFEFYLIVIPATAPVCA